MDDREAIKNFLLDIQCLDRLTKWSNKFNLFDVLKVSGTEIRHSNTLAWLLNPSENHGLGDTVIRRIIQKMSQAVDSSEIFHTLLLDFQNADVRREWKNIDILAILPKEHFLLCIENKVFSGEHDNQLQKYQKTLQKEFPDYQKIFIFLTPDGSLPENEELNSDWQPLSYTDVVEIIELAITEKTVTNEVHFFINQYIDAVRRTIVGDQELVQICQEIYAKHKQALDLIYENRMDTSTNTADIIKDWCEKNAKEGKVGFDPSNSNKTYIRFTTKAMTNLLPEHKEPVSGWKSKSMYFYEIQNRSGYIVVNLSVCSDNLTEGQIECCDKLSKVLNKSDKKENWRWKRLFSTARYNYSPDEPIEEIRKKIFNELNRSLKEITLFENNICIN